MKQKDKIKCINCKHILSYDDIKEIWSHKHTLHNNNCECRNPVPNFKPMQNKLRKELDQIFIDASKRIKPDYSRGWNDISVEDMFRPFTI